MILIGQYDSPFVRRVGLALQIYGLNYEHRPWSTYSDAEEISHYNPLRRVPTLVLDDGEVLIESGAILDYLDELAEPVRRLIAATGAERRETLRICALATGLCDKMVSLVYENSFHSLTSDMWIERCTLQIRSVLDVLEHSLVAEKGQFWFGDRPGHADIACACALGFLAEVHPAILASGNWPSLRGHAEICEALEPFQIVKQRFKPPESV